MLLYGAGGHAKVIAACLSAQGVKLAGIFDYNPHALASLGAPVFNGYNPGIHPEQTLIISVGDNSLRNNISKTIQHTFGKIAHPSALVDPTALFGDGTVLLHRCIVQAAVLIGKHVIINTGAVIEHDVIIGDYCHVAPGAILCGNVKVGEGSLIGAGCIITPNINIASNCLIAAGSVVTTSIPDGAVVRGNPARIITIRKHECL